MPGEKWVSVTNPNPASYFCSLARCNSNPQPAEHCGLPGQTLLVGQNFTQSSQPVHRNQLIKSCLQCGKAGGALAVEGFGELVQQPVQVLVGLALLLNLSDRMHYGVMHSIGKIEEQRQSDKDLNRLLNKLTETLNS